MDATLDSNLNEAMIEWPSRDEAESILLELFRVDDREEQQPGTAYFPVI